MPGPNISGVRRDWILAALVSAGFVGGGGAYVAQSRVDTPAPVIVEITSVETGLSSGTLVVAGPQQRTLDPYSGYGTWVDVFDYAPAYAGAEPPVSIGTLAEMAELGVGTVYLQAARLDDRTPDGLEDPWLLAEMLVTAHELGMDVVAWYLPRFGDDDADLDRITAMADFEVLGHRFDGMAVDIEWTGDGIDHDTRSERLVELSRAARQVLGREPLGAIVLPPVQIEVVNPDFWPGFPWAGIADQYDVWLPMSYWSFRSESSGYSDGYAYHEESVRRLRNNLGDQNALVHGIGGIGGTDGVDDDPQPPEPLTSIDELQNFADALTDTGSIGVSMYDWNTLEPAVRLRLAELFSVR